MTDEKRHVCEICGGPVEAAPGPDEAAICRACLEKSWAAFSEKYGERLGWKPKGRLLFFSSSWKTYAGLAAAACLVVALGLTIILLLDHDDGAYVGMKGILDELSARIPVRFLVVGSDGLKTRGKTGGDFSPGNSIVVEFEAPEPGYALLSASEEGAAVFSSIESDQTGKLLPAGKHVFTSGGSPLGIPLDQFDGKVFFRVILSKNPKDFSPHALIGEGSFSITVR